MRRGGESPLKVFSSPRSINGGRGIGGGRRGGGGGVSGTLMQIKPL